jgi:sugar lactone lactonase YvrE
MRKLFLVPLIIACTLVAACSSDTDVETVALFDSTVPETPESIQVDLQGIVYVSLARTGEIRKIDPDDGPQSTLAFLTAAPGNVCPNRPGRATIAGIALDHEGNVYVGVIACDAKDHGIWKVTPGGQQSLVANLPGNARPNGIAYHAGSLYVADSALARVWRVQAEGGSPAEIWTDDQFLQHPPSPPPVPGPNGLQIFHDEVYVSVSSRGHIVAFPIREDRSAGPGRVHVDEIGVDDFAFDEKGNLYAMTNFAQTVERVTPDGRVEILLKLADGLDGPSSGAFGVGRDNKNLYIANAAFPTAPPPTPTPRRPSVMRLHVGIPGQPRP